jgi:hypothetical protein
MSKHGGKNFNPNGVNNTNNSSNANNNSSSEHDVSKSSLKTLDDEMTNSSEHNYETEDEDEESEDSDADEQAGDEDEDDAKEAAKPIEKNESDNNPAAAAASTTTESEKDTRGGSVHSALYITTPASLSDVVPNYSNVSSASAEFLHSKENMPRPHEHMTIGGPYSAIPSSTGVSPVVVPQNQHQLTNGMMEVGHHQQHHHQNNWPFYPVTVNRMSNFGGAGSYSNDLMKHQPQQQQLQQHQSYHQQQQQQQQQPSQPQYGSTIQTSSSFYNFNMTPLSASSPSQASAKFNNNSSSISSPMSSGPVSSSDFNTYMYPYQSTYATTPQAAYTATPYGNFYA